MQNYPLYLLQLDTMRVIFPADKEDVDHTEFWESVAAHLVAKHYKLQHEMLVNLPYCQRRARIVGDKCYYGETHEPKLLDLISRAVGNNNLAFFYDEHEKRLKEDMLELHRLLRYWPKSTIT